MKTIKERVLEVAWQKSVFRARDVQDATDPRCYAPSATDL